MCQLSASEETSCFTSIAVVYRVLGEALLKGFREMEITGPQAGSLVCNLIMP
jgi:hypothetical protein